LGRSGLNPVVEKSHYGVKVMNFEELKLIAIVSNELLKKSNVIICLEGDGYSRIDVAAKLFKEKWAPLVVISGGYNNPPSSIPASDLAKELIKKGVTTKKIILEEK